MRVLQQSLFFSHTDLMPFVEPCTKDLVTTPVTGLLSLSTCSSSVQPLFYLHGLNAPTPVTLSSSSDEQTQLRDKRV